MALFFEPSASHFVSGRYSLPSASMLFFRCPRQLDVQGALTMEWITPQHEEIDLNCEISSYANAEL
jgi:hypothetical protein